MADNDVVLPKLRKCHSTQSRNCLEMVAFPPKSRDQGLESHPVVIYRDTKVFDGHEKNDAIKNNTTLQGVLEQIRDAKCTYRRLDGI